MPADNSVETASEYVLRAIGVRPGLAIISGSGQSGLGRSLGLKHEIGFHEIPGFPEPTVEGHSGKLIFGTAGEVPTLFFSGRTHFYEDPAPQNVTFAVRLCARLGVSRLVLLNAAGGLNPQFQPGDLMAITDILNLQFRSSLIGSNENERGKLIPGRGGTLDSNLLSELQSAARETRIKLHRGVYAAMLGPTYETSAEVRMLREIGADAVGMSTVPEIQAACQAGLRVSAISCITNSHVHNGPPPTHEEVLKNAAKANQNLVKILRKFIRTI